MSERTRKTRKANTTCLVLLVSSFHNVASILILPSSKYVRTVSTLRICPGMEIDLYYNFYDPSTFICDTVQVDSTCITERNELALFLA